MSVVAPPYTVEQLPYGPHMRPTKKYPNGAYGSILTPEEVAVWEYVQTLESQIQERQDSQTSEELPVAAAVEAPTEPVPPPTEVRAPAPKPDPRRKSR